MTFFLSNVSLPIDGCAGMFSEGFYLKIITGRYIILKF